MYKTLITMNKLLLLVVFVVGLALVESHGFLENPLARTSIQRMPNHGAPPPFWWDNAGVNCGDTRQDLNISTCGRCGDIPGNSHAARGGRYDKGIITGRYTAGAQIDVTVQFTGNHRGFFEYELCLLNDDESDNCFQRLTILSGSEVIRDEIRICAGTQRTGPVNARLQLPAGFRCNRCTLRWTYRTAYPPAVDACFDPNPAQIFRNCADIAIS